MQNKFEENPSTLLNEEQCSSLNFISAEITLSKRPLEAWILKQLLTKNSLTDKDILSNFQTHNVFCDQESIDNAASVLNMNYFSKTKLKKYGNVALTRRTNNNWSFTTKLRLLLQSPTFKKYFTDALDANLWELHQNPSKYQNRFTIGEKYYRSDIIKMLNWEKEPNYLSIGGYSLRQDDRFLPVFISLKKNEKFQNKMIYKNTFLDRSTIPWFSKGGRSTSSTTEKKILEYQGFGMIQLFVRKSTNSSVDGTDFYYLGTARILSAKDVIEKNVDGKPTKLVEFILRLEHEVDLGLYRVLTE